MLALPLTVPSVASTVCVVPGRLPPQIGPVQGGPLWTEKLVCAVTSPSELPKASRPWAEKVWVGAGAAGSSWYSACGACGAVAETVACAGEIEIWARSPGAIANACWAVSPPKAAVTVCGPALVALQTLPVHE